MNTQTSNSLLDAIRDKVEAGQRLSAAEGEWLFAPEVDLHAVGELADLVRRRKNGNVAYYNVNAHLNPTNVCRYRCELCAYSRDASDADAYVMGRDEILARGEEAVRNGCTELHVVGGLHPDKKFDWYHDLLAALHEAYPKLLLKAFTAVEIWRFAELTGWSVGRVLEKLIDAGLRCLPGGGAEILAPEIRRQICKKKPGGDRWLEVHREAHRLGLKTNATMLYGHVERAEHRIDHMVRLRELQDETGGFLTFIPLAFHPDGTQLADLHRTSGLDDLRTMAVSRLMLDNFEHVKAYWISLGVGTAQAALGYGADDLDGTVRHEKIHHEAGSQAPEILSVEQIRRLIAEAGREPVERDTLYRRVRRKGMEWDVES
jgi:aminodeoxyfutalosine synthase